MQDIGMQKQIISIKNQNYDKSKESSYIQYLDTNNLY